MKKKPISTTNVFDADITLIHSMMDWIRDQLKLVKQPNGELKKVEVALEEALVNIISYAYKRPGGIVQLIFYYMPENELSFTIKDKGIPFNPLRKESEIEEYLPLEEREEGGLGIPMIHKLMDYIHYERQEDTNVLILSKKCAA